MEVLGLWMLVVLTALLLLGCPVALAIGATALFFGWWQFGLEIFKLLPLRVWGLMTNLTLIAVPLFVFMGLVLERSGIADELLDTMSRMFGRLRGGLAISVVIVGALWSQWGYWPFRRCSDTTILRS